MRRLALVPALAIAFAAQAADLPYGRLFYTPEQRAALEDARRRNIRAEELAAQAATAPKAPRPRKLTVTGVVQRSDGESFAWINGKQVESETKDGMRVRHAAGQTGVVVYDPEKRRSVSVKVGQQIDLTTGRIEESYESKRGQAQAPAETENDGEAAPAAAAILTLEILTQICPTRIDCFNQLNFFPSGTSFDLLLPQYSIIWISVYLIIDQFGHVVMRGKTPIHFILMLKDPSF